MRLESISMCEKRERENKPTCKRRAREGEQKN